jgi:8-oxo-dGTP pyrophosphatase MutT (NUDIX family)
LAWRKGEVLCWVMADSLDHSVAPFTEAGFRALAKQGLASVPSQAVFDPRSGRALGPGDWDLNPELRADLAVMHPPRAAAVLVPIMLRPQLTVLLTQRSHEVPSHPGQISFPGGKVEPGDASPLACALREAQEEIGLPPECVEPLGYLDAYRTGTGFQINPVVAFVRPGFAVVVDPREVAEVFEVPLSFLMDTANHHKHSREWRGRQRSYYVMPYPGRYIWGATAGMLKNMHERLLQR